MKTNTEDLNAFWASPDHMEELREELRKRMAREELESALRLEILDRLVSALKTNRTDFQHLWLQPLLTEGLSVDKAISLIAESHFRPN